MVGKRIYSGIDWLTVTTADKTVADKWAGELFPLICPVPVINPAAFVQHLQGYVGSGNKGVFMGDRSDGWMARLSGTTAFANAVKLLRYGGRPSRLDLQITVRYENGHKVMIEQAFQDACTFNHKRGAPIDIEMRVGKYGPRALTLGSRISEIYMRIYDKQEESGETFYNRCVRYEVELKGKTAHRINEYLREKDYGLDAIESVVCSIANDRGVVIPGDFSDEHLHIVAETNRTTIESKRAWLVTQVAPTVSSLIDECGLGPIMLDVLDGKRDRALVSDIIEIAAKAWGS